MKLYQIVGNVLRVDPATLNEDSNAQNTERWDSLRHIEVIFAVKSAFHVRFTMPEIASLRKLGDIRQLLISKGADLSEPVDHRKIA
jgi:acyl carrier protein